MDNNLFTIGHSNLTFEDFADLLMHFSIEILVDVCSYSWRTYAPDNKHFDKAQLRQDCSANTGDLLGGDWDERYKLNGRVKYVMSSMIHGFKRGYRNFSACSTVDDGLHWCVQKKIPQNAIEVC